MLYRKIPPNNINAGDKTNRQRREKNNQIFFINWIHKISENY